jgi:hypothetical protein
MKGGDMAYAPYLTEDQINRIRVYAKPRQVMADEILYEPGFDNATRLRSFVRRNQDCGSGRQRREDRNHLSARPIFRGVVDDLRSALDLPLSGC